MNPLALTRIVSACTFKVQRKLLRFAWHGRKAIGAFERRRRRNDPFFPAFLMLSVTNRCNLKCKGCWVEQTREPQQLSLSQMQGMIDTAAKYGSQFFGILGGEPLFHPDVFTLFENNPQAYFQLFTNGTMLDAKATERLARLGNVTPVISIEGLEQESHVRRGQQDVFVRSMTGIDASVKAGLFTGVATSICKRNFDELVSTDFLDLLVKKGLHYVWYYIYRPCGSEPDVGNALDEDQVVALRKFLVEQRCRSRLIIIDAYWDAEGRAVCPGAMGLSHHIAPNGGVEFCPIVQFAGDCLNENASNIETIFQQNAFLGNLRSFCTNIGRNCVLMESPRELADFLQSNNAIDTSGRDSLTEIAAREPMTCHDIKGREIPEKSWAYRFGKKYYFFGFGAYG